MQPGRGRITVELLLEDRLAPLGERGVAATIGVREGRHQLLPLGFDLREPPALSLPATKRWNRALVPR